MNHQKRFLSLIILALLIIAIGINYVDRGSLAVVKTDIQSEFQLNDNQMGLLFSAFFWSYALFQIVAGWAVDRYDVKWLYLGGFLMWSAATVLMGFANGFMMLFALRILLGLGESVAYPATSQMIVKNFEEKYRGLANALIDAATKLGPAISLFLGATIVTQHGWRALFWFVGIAGLVWVPFWIYFAPSTRKGNSDQLNLDRPRGVSFRQLLSRPEVWATSAGFFCIGYTWAFFVSWWPSYLEVTREFSKEAMGRLGSLPFLSMGITGIIGGGLADYLIRRGNSPTRVRKSFLVTGMLASAALMFLAIQVKDGLHCVWLMTASGAFLGLYTANVWAVTQTLAGTPAAGQWSGFQNAIGNMGAAISPALAGQLIDQSKNYTLAFNLAALILVVGSLIYWLFIPKIAELNWQTETRSPLESI